MGPASGSRGPFSFMRPFTRAGLPRMEPADAPHGEHWATWDEALLAVADGEVVEAVDTLADNPPGEYGRGAANRLVIRVAEGRFAVYAHLRRGSLRVRVGETVRRGQTVAHVGNSGNSTSGHLHFQVLDAPSSIAGEGVPFVFDRYEVQGMIDRTVDDYEAGAAWRPQADAGSERWREIPVGGEVIRF